MQRLGNIVAFVAAISLVSIAGDAVADSAAAVDFNRLCIATHADAAAAFAAADASGWTRDVVDSNNFAGLSGNPDGREINRGTTAFRAVTAGQIVVGGETRNKCILVSQEPFETFVQELSRVIPAPVGTHTGQQWSWNYVQSGGTFRSLDHMSVEDAARAGQSGAPQVHIVAVPVTGGAIALYSESTFEASQ